MKIDPESLDGRARYALLISAVVPRPIAFVTSVGAGGIVNLAPFSFFQGISSSPPTVMLSISRKRDGSRKDTWRNIEAGGDFVVHGVTDDLLDAVLVAAADWPEEVSEVEKAGLVLAPSDRVRTPRLAAARVAMECRLEALHEIHGVGLVIGEVLRVHADDALLVPGRPEIDNARYLPVARLGGDLYVRGGEVLRRPRRRVEDLA